MIWAYSSIFLIFLNWCNPIRFNYFDASWFIVLLSSYLKWNVSGDLPFALEPPNHILMATISSTEMKEANITRVLIANFPLGWQPNILYSIQHYRVIMISTVMPASVSLTPWSPKINTINWLFYKLGLKYPRITQYNTI